MTKAVQMPSAAGAVDAPRGAWRAAQGGMAGEGTRSLRPWYGLMALGGGLATSGADVVAWIGLAGLIGLMLVLGLLL
jgi:hypothetical protein